MLTSSKPIAAVAVLLIALSLGIAYHAQYVQGVLPCPLCLLQRYLFMLIGVLFLFAWMANPRSVVGRILSALLFVTSLAGVVLGLRQLYLQMQPPASVQACLPGIHYLFQTMHWSEALRTIFRGSAECGVVHWRMLGMSMAFWSACLFIVLLILSILWMKAKGSRKRSA